jgi:hypothetical protein
MLLRLLFPYFLLFIIVMGYLYLRRSRLGPVLLKIKRVMFSRFNNDSFILIFLLAGVSYLLIRYELQNMPLDEQLPLGPYTFVLFYGVLLLVVIAREIEMPALREKGISTARGFWSWSEIDSFRWSKDVLTINLNRGKRKRSESWQIVPGAKKEIEQVLKQKVTRKSARSKK